jgi:hypothetical protein
LNTDAIFYQLVELGMTYLEGPTAWAENDLFNFLNTIMSQSFIYPIAGASFGAVNFVAAAAATYFNNVAIVALALKEIVSDNIFGIPAHTVLDYIVFFTQRSR